MHMHPTPFDRSYWIVPGKLLAGFFPGNVDPETAAAYQRALVKCGIRSVMNLMEPDETNLAGDPFPPYDEALNAYASELDCTITCQRISVRDMNVPTPETMVRILDAIDAAIEGGEPVYVHCWGGRGRTGTVVGCWMVRHGMAADGNEALELLHELRRVLPQQEARRVSPETEAQRDMVRSWGYGM
jgi:hypothetical protein